MQTLRTADSTGVTAELTITGVSGPLPDSIVTYMANAFHALPQQVAYSHTNEAGAKFDGTLAPHTREIALVQAEYPPDTPATLSAAVAA